jgi:hypothetical protein
MMRKTLSSKHAINVSWSVRAQRFMTKAGFRFARASLASRSIFWTATATKRFRSCWRRLHNGLSRNRFRADLRMAVAFLGNPSRAFHFLIFRFVVRKIPRVGLLQGSFCRSFDRGQRIFVSRFPSRRVALCYCEFFVFQSFPLRSFRRCARIGMISANQPNAVKSPRSKPRLATSRDAET